MPEHLCETFLGVLGLLLGSQVTPPMAQLLLDLPTSAMLLLLGVAAATAVAAVWGRCRQCLVCLGSQGP